MGVPLQTRSIGFALVLGSVVTGVKLCGSVTVFCIMVILNSMGNGKPLTDEMRKQQVKAADQKSIKSFIEKTSNCVIITNASNKRWKVGYLNKFDKSELQMEQSGTAEGQGYSADLTFNHGTDPLNAETRPVLVMPGYGSIAIKPRCEKTGLMSWKKFFRVFYLEDEAGQRIYLNITKGTADKDVPQVGLAAATYGKVMKDRGAGPKLLELYNPTVCKNPQWLRTNLIAIRGDAVEP